MPAAIAKGKLGHILFVCPDSEITENFIELLKLKLSEKSAKTCMLSYETAPGDIAAVLTTATENALLVFHSKILDISEESEKVLKEAMGSFSLDFILGKGPCAKSIQLDLPNFSSVICVEKPSQSLLPLMPCFEYVIQIDTSMLTQHCEEVLQNEAFVNGLQIEQEDIEYILKTARFNVSTAKRYLDRVAEYIAFKQIRESHISHQFIEEVFSLTGISEESSAFEEPIEAELMLKEIRNTLRSLQSDIASIQSDLAAMRESHLGY